MKSNMNDINKMIKEELQRVLEKRNLLKKLNQVNEALDQMKQEDGNLNEVEVDGKTTVASNAWTGKPNGDEKFKPKFEKIGSSLKEDETEESDIDMNSSDSGSDLDSLSAEEKNPMGEFENKFAEIGKAIDAKLSTETSPVGSSPAAASEKPEDGMDFDDVIAVDKEDSENPSGDPKEDIDEYKETVGGVGAEQGMTADQAIKKESVEEPIQGSSVTQEADEDDVNENMEKTKHVQEGKKNSTKVITEEKKPESKNLFLEGLTPEGKASFLAERNRMLKFAGLKTDEDEE